MAKKWYAVHVATNQEERVKKLLEERIRQEGLEDRFEQILVPTEEVIEIRHGKQRRTQRKFFPGYLLVKMEMDERTWQLVRNTPHVLGFIGGERPTPLSEKEAEAIIARMEEGRAKPKPKVLFEPGEVVRIKEGPFQDFQGVVEEVDYEKSRLRVSVSIFGRSTPVEFAFNQVEKLS